MIFALGVIGGLILVIGSAWPEKKSNTALSSKRNWYFAAGNLLIFAYALLNWYFNTGAVFFVILETLILVATVLMLRPIAANQSALVFGLAGAGLSLFSLTLFEGYQTLIFIAGLAIVSFGFSLPPQSEKRNLVLALGSGLIALFSYLGADWIFFWLNIFFAFFSAYHFWKK